MVFKNKKCHEGRNGSGRQGLDQSVSDEGAERSVDNTYIDREERMPVEDEKSPTLAVAVSQHLINLVI